MKSRIHAMSHTDWLLLILLSILWGGSFFFVGVAVGALPPLTLVALRVSLAAIALYGVVHYSGLRMPADPGVWRAFFAIGVLNNVIPFSLIVWGQTTIASGLAAILNATTPLFGVIAAHLFTVDEKLTCRKSVGIGLGFTGVVVMLGHGVLTGHGDSIFGQLAVLTAALSYALAGIYGRRFSRMGTRPLVTATGQVTASSCILVPLALLVDQPFASPLPGVEIWLAITGLALISTALAYILYFRILATAGATNVLLVTLLIPISAILLGGVFLDEQLEPRHMIGMGLVAFGLLAIDGRLFPVRAAKN